MTGHPRAFGGVRPGPVLLDNNFRRSRRYDNARLPAAAAWGGVKMAEEKLAPVSDGFSVVLPGWRAAW